MRTNNTDLLIGLIFLIGLVLAYIIYEPGIHGSFIFDDFNNLTLLGQSGGVTDWVSLKRYLLSGYSGPTGRPLSMLTFLIDANNWPAAPGPFKYTNIMIHLLTGTALFTFLLSVMKWYEGVENLSRTAKWSALFAALFWLFHPYLVSTTLYVVERMAQLAALFVLFGLAAWLRGRRLVASRPLAGYVWMTFGIGFLGLLAVFSKENGALLVALALFLELALVRESALYTPINRIWLWVFLVLPTLFIASYLVYCGFSNGWFVEYPGRQFTPWQRVLTEPRIIWVYLYHWFVPHFFTSGVYHDDIVKSLSPWHPWTTLSSMIGLFLVVAGAWKVRDKYALFFIAIALFLISLSIESTTVNLELMFEHRVYLGIGILFLPILYYSMGYFSTSKVILFASLWLVLLAIFCRAGTSLWGDYPMMALVWAETTPHSARAQNEVARMKYNRGDKEGALEWLNAAAKNNPDDFFLRMSQVTVQCNLDSVKIRDREAVLALAKRQPYSATWLDLMRKAIQVIHESRCKKLTEKFIVKLTDNFLSQSRNRVSNSLVYSQLEYSRGVALFLLKKNKPAYDSMMVSIKNDKGLDRRMIIAAYLATYGYKKEARDIAVEVLHRLKEGGLRGRDLAQAPSIKNVETFIKNIQ